MEDSKIRSDLNAREKAIEEGESFDDEVRRTEEKLNLTYIIPTTYLA